MILEQQMLWLKYPDQGCLSGQKGDVHSHLRWVDKRVMYIAIYEGCLSGQKGDVHSHLRWVDKRVMYIAIYVPLSKWHPNISLKIEPWILRNWVYVIHPPQKIVTNQLNLFSFHLWWHITLYLAMACSYYSLQKVQWFHTKSLAVVTFLCPIYVSTGEK